MADLTDKQRRFIDAYLVCWNATEAAARAGYSGARASLAQIGHENLRKLEIRAEIDARLSESAMPASEVLARLTEIARSSMADFLSPRGKGVALDLKRASDAGALHLVKKYTKTKQGVTIELYDAQAALVKLGEHHRLFVQRQEITGKDGGPIDIVDAREQLAAALAGLVTPSDAEPASGRDRDPAAGDGGSAGA